MYRHIRVLYPTQQRSPVVVTVLCLNLAWDGFLLMTVTFSVAQNLHQIIITLPKLTEILLMVHKNIKTSNIDHLTLLLNEKLQLTKRDRVEKYCMFFFY